MTAIYVFLKPLYNFWHLWLWLLAGKVHSYILQAFKFTKYVTDSSISPPTQSTKLLSSKTYSILCKYWVSLQNILNLFPLISAYMDYFHRFLFSLIFIQLLELSLLKCICSYYSYVQNFLWLIIVYGTWLWSFLKAFFLIISFIQSTLWYQNTQNSLNILTLSWLYFVLFFFIAFHIF